MKNTASAALTPRRLCSEIAVTKERSFRRSNGKEVRLRELTDLIAIRLPEEAAPPSDAKHKERKPRLKRKTFNAIAPEVSLPQVRAFEDAGWVFVRNLDPVDISAEVPHAKVFVKRGGRLALDTNRLVVQLNGDFSQQQAAEILQPYGCRVLNELGFAPSLFRVELTSLTHGDTLDVANSLTVSGVCKFAEPELLEVVGGR